MAAIRGCSSIPGPQAVYLGHLEAYEAAKHVHAMYQARMPWSRNLSIEPVADLLARLGAASHAQQSAASFPSRSRAMVAAQLALGVSLPDGSRLRKDWSSNDIVLIRNASQSRTAAGTLHEEDVLLLPCRPQNSDAASKADAMIRDGALEPTAMCGFVCTGLDPDRTELGGATRCSEGPV